MRRIFTLIILSICACSISVSAEVKNVNEVQSPQFTVNSDTYSETQFVEFLCAAEDVEIYYTLDGTTPDRDSYLYDGNPIVISTTTVLKAIAYKGNQSSEVAVAQYVIEGTGTSGIISNIFKKRNSIEGGRGTITVTGTASAKAVSVYSITGQEVDIDSGRTTTVKGSGDNPDRVVVKIDEPGVYAVKAPNASKVVVVR
jgi:hypothetical protein